ncbi:MAG: putative two-component sensor [Glaciihabitans sp.]|nr:putative two-component sensor [Glaciihabitans sp.]
MTDDFRPGVPAVTSDSALDAMTELAGLLAAVVDDASLDLFLRAAVESAAVLAGISTAFIALLNSDGRVRLVTSSGTSPASGVTTLGAGDAQALLAQFVRDPTVLRAADFLDRPELENIRDRLSMQRRPVVALPVISRGSVRGFVYLAGTQNPGRGRADEERVARMITSLVASAVREPPVVVDPERHARTVCRAASDATSFVRATGDWARSESFRGMAEGARRAAGAESAVVVMDSSGGAHIIGVAGDGVESLAGREITDDQHGITALLERIDTATHSTARDFEDNWEQRWWQDVPQRGDILLVPFTCDGTDSGFVALARSKGSAGFSEEDTIVASAYSTHLRHSISTAMASQQSEDLAVFAERERISRDLHDRIFQRLYATNLGLQHVRGESQAGPIAPSIDAAIAGVDGIIRELRGTVNTLGAAPGMPDGLRGEVQDIVKRIAGGGDYDVRVRLLGPVDAVGVHQGADDLLAALTEGLSNAVRHSRAALIEVDIAVSGDRLSLTVTDDGAGINVPRPGNGLGNLRRRAELAGGSFTITPRQPRGTELVWTVPRLPATT